MATCFQVVIKINYSNSQDLIYPLGYDPFLNKKFDNSIFTANCVNFLLEKPAESGKYLFEIKNKQFDNYPFNESKIKSKQKKWSALNNIIPISLILFINLVNYIFERKKNTLNEEKNLHTNNPYSYTINTNLLYIIKK